MNQSKTILKNVSVVTMNSSRDILHNAYIEIEDGLIRSVGPMTSMPSELDSSQTIDLDGHLILPGLIDCSGYAGQMALQGVGTESTIGQVQVRDQISADLKDFSFYRDDAVLFAVERLRRGVTTGVVIFQEDNSLSIDKVDAYVLSYRSVGTNIFPVCHPSVATTNSEALFVDAKDAGLAVEQIHHAIEARTSRDEKVFVKGYAGLVDLLSDASDQLEDANLVFLHCNGMSYSEAACIAHNEWSVVHTPVPSLRYAPFFELWSMGVRPAISAHHPSYYANSDLIQAVRRAQMLEQLRMDDLNLFPIGSQLETLTIHAAETLGIESSHGSIEAGKRADLICIQMDRPHLIPWKTMPLHRFMMDGNANDIAHVIIEGRFTMYNRILMDMPDPVEVTNRDELFRDLTTSPDFGRAYRRSEENYFYV